MQNISIATPDHIRLAALVSLPERPRGLLISCHGFRGAKENAGRIFGLAEKLSRVDIGLLAFDFQGSGQSGGDYKTITLSRQARDLQTVLDYAGRKYDLPLYLLGRSFGGSTVLAGAGKRPEVRGYIFWSTPVFLHKTFAPLLKSAVEQWEQDHTATVADEGGRFELASDFLKDLDRHRMDDYVLSIGNRSVLIVHGLADEIVSPDNARHMAKLLPHAELHLAEGADHRFTDHSERREAITINWLLGLREKDRVVPNHSLIEMHPGH